MLPELTSSAAAARRRTGRSTVWCSSTLSTTSTTANTTARPPTSVTKVASARARATRMGSDTMAAPTTSPAFQPKPLPVPYRSIMEAGAAAGVEWHGRQPGSARMGWDSESTVPAGVSRSLTSSGRAGSWRKTSMMSACQSVARSAGLVGLSAASRKL